MFYLCGKLVIWAPNCQGLQRKVFEIRTCCYKSECSHSSRINRPLENSSSGNCHRPVMLCTPANMTSLGGQVPWLFDCAPCQVEHVPWKHLLGEEAGLVTYPCLRRESLLRRQPHLTWLATGHHQTVRAVTSDLSRAQGLPNSDSPLSCFLPPWPLDSLSLYSTALAALGEEKAQNLFALSLL